MGDASSSDSPFIEPASDSPFIEPAPESVEGDNEEILLPGASERADSEGGGRFFCWLGGAAGCRGAALATTWAPVVAAVTFGFLLAEEADE